MTAVEIITASRLHFGLLCGRQGAKWNFGGVGMMLQTPAWHIVARPSDRVDVVASPALIEKRLKTLIPEACRLAGLSGLSVNVRQSMSLHSGLGAGTQLTLAVATAALIVAGKPRPAHAIELAGQMQRAQRSAVGSTGFDRGGFLVDEGLSEEGTARTVHRAEFPESWRMVLVSSVDTQGLSGTAEKADVVGARQFAAAVD